MTSASAPFAAAAPLRVAPPALRGLFAWGVAIAGCVFAAVVVAEGVAADALPLSREVLLLTALVVATEVRPIVLQRRSHIDAVTTSGIFVFAILLQWGLAPALLAQAIASVADDLKDRVVSIRTMLFNVGQYSLALGAAAGVLMAFDVGFPVPLTGARDLAAFGVAAAAFIVVNFFLPGLDIELAEGWASPHALVEDLPFHASVNGVVLALSPVVVIAANQSPAVIGLLALPMMFVYRSARIAVEKQHLALHDALTDLPNRVAFQEAAQAVLADRDMRRGYIGVVVIDVDDFKEVNDTLGHHVGDALLRQIGRRLDECAQAPDFAARLGGDEFVLLLPGLVRPEAAEDAVQRTLAALDEPFELNDLKFQLHASAGIAVYPDDGVEVSTLLQRADVAMYVAKRDRTGSERYDPARDQHSVKRLTMMSELREAIRSGQLAVHYQPQVDMATGMIRGVEALLRWDHPRFGRVPPEDFIRLSEQTGVIRDVTTFVLNTAMADLAAWRASGYDIRLAVNVSSRDLRDATLVDQVERLLDEHDVPPDRLAVEITESALVEDSDTTLAVLNRLHDLGVSLAVDDYGTGYASLAYLARMPVDCIKIDRSFVGTMAVVEANAVIVRSTINLARDLGFTVVAEGVESAPVWRSLAEMGCGTAQGFYVSRAVPRDRLTIQLDEPVTVTPALQGSTPAR